MTFILLIFTAMKIGYELKNKRDSKKLSQQEVADYLQVSQRTYSNFESDKSKPSTEQLIKLATLLDFDLMEVLQKEGFVFNQTNEGVSNNGLVHNNMPEKLIEQYEARISTQQELINLLREELSRIRK